MAKKKTKRKSGGTGKVGAFAAGALIATAAVGYFLYGPKGAQNRKKVESWTIRAKGEVLSKLETAREVSEESYHKIVDGVTARYGRMKDVGDKKANELNRELKRHWSKLKRETKGTAKGTKKKVDTIRRKIARKIEPKRKV